MRLKPSHMIKIANGKNSLGKVKNEVVAWETFVNRFRKPTRTAETLKEYLALPKEEQDKLKNIDGFWIGCQCIEGSRRKANLLPRDVITLDFDKLTPEQFKAILERSSNLLKRVGFMVHTTRKHTPKAPRIRVVIPTASRISVDVYNAASRLAAFAIDKTMNSVDDVSFRPAQMMFKPSCSKNSEYIFRVFDGDLLEPADLYEAFKKRGFDYRNHYDLPYSEEQGQKRLAADKAEDPFEKEGVVGAFCRTYPISRAIEEFLSEFYVPGDMTGPKPRYSYAKGTTSNGVEVQDDDRFIYSHHTSDPCSETLCNSFDMVRLCLFESLDKAEDLEKAINRRPSYKAMAEFALKQPGVKDDVAKRRYDFEEGLVENFDDLTADALPAEREQETDTGDDADLLAQDEPDLLALDPEPEPEDDDLAAFESLGPEEDELDHVPAKIEPKPQAVRERPPKDWIEDLETDKEGNIKKTLTNLVSIYLYDPRLFQRFAYNQLLTEEVLLRPITLKHRADLSLKVEDRENGDRVVDYMLAQIRSILEAPKGAPRYGYGFPHVSKEDLNAALSLVARRHEFHPVKIYLEAILPLWDGKPRLATVLQRYFHADDNAYTREAFKLMMVAAVARQYEPGHKFDQCMILQGQQGIGKSTFLSILGRQKWFSIFDCGFDDLNRAIEKMKGVVILEIGELSSYHKSDLDNFKSFLSNTVDNARLAYKTRPEVFRRQSVFFGTTNAEQYLRDLTGNRRMWPIQCNVPRGQRIDFAAWEAEVPMLWAEAYHLYLEMRKAKPKKYGDLYLDLPEIAQPFARAAQDGAQMETPAELWAAEISAWLDAPLRKDELLAEISGEDFADMTAKEGSELVVRTCVSTRQIWTKALGRRPEAIDRGYGQLAQALPLVQGWRQEHKGKKRKFQGQSLRAMIRVDATEAEIQRRCRPASPSIDDLL